MDFRIRGAHDDFDDLLEAERPIPNFLYFGGVCSGSDGGLAGRKASTFVSILDTSASLNKRSRAD